MRYKNLLVRRATSTNNDSRQQSGIQAHKSSSSSTLTCNNFNANKCFRGEQCRYAHICFNCQQNHSTMSCSRPHNSSSSLQLSSSLKASATSFQHRICRPPLGLSAVAPASAYFSLSTPSPRFSAKLLAATSLLTVNALKRSAPSCPSSLVSPF